MAEPSKPTPPKAHQDPSKPFSGFLYKLILVSVIIALLPIFPSSQSPELSSKSILARSWELLHLLLVGIAISYGVFSRRNSDPAEILEKETHPKADTPQSYVSHILQVSPVFDDVEEIHSPKASGLADETKTQTWNYSQYYREEPVVMVEEAADGTNSSTKPLFLPVRSLKSRPQPQYYDEINEPSFMPKATDEAGKSCVLPSPIPWRSRSGRMEVKEDMSSNSPRSPINISEQGGLSRTRSFRSHTPRESSKTPPSPKRVSPPPSYSPEMRGKLNEDFGRKRSFSKPAPPPPPPPPPPTFYHASYFMSEKRNARKSLKDELEHLNRNGKSRDGFLPSNGTAGSGGSCNFEDSYIRRSVRTVRSKEGQNLPPLPRNRSARKKNEFREKMIINSDSESDDHDGSGLSESDAGETISNSVSTEEAVAEENEVDKKADEFIAKFREQIRLQRIASIKRSTGQRSSRNSN